MDFFGIGPLELIVILVVALLVLGPKQLPQLAFRLGNLLNQARSSIAQARESILFDLEAENPSPRATLLADHADPEPDSRQSSS